MRKLWTGGRGAGATSNAFPLFSSRERGLESGEGACLHAAGELVEHRQEHLSPRRAPRVRRQVHLRHSRTTSRGVHFVRMGAARAGFQMQVSPLNKHAAILLLPRA